VIGDVDPFSNVKFELKSNVGKVGIPLIEKNIYNIYETEPTI
jgi:hypothetical protein